MTFWSFKSLTCATLISLSPNALGSNCPSIEHIQWNIQESFWNLICDSERGFAHELKCVLEGGKSWVELEDFIAKWVEQILNENKINGTNRDDKKNDLICLFKLAIYDWKFKDYEIQKVNIRISYILNR
jgi:hypothetical protein